MINGMDGYDWNKVSGGGIESRAQYMIQALHIAQHVHASFSPSSYNIYMMIDVMYVFIHMLHDDIYK